MMGAGWGLGTVGGASSWGGHLGVWGLTLRRRCCHLTAPASGSVKTHRHFKGRKCILLSALFSLDYFVFLLVCSF